jgi:hypothetical protein
MNDDEVGGEHKARGEGAEGSPVDPTSPEHVAHAIRGLREQLARMEQLLAEAPPAVRRFERVLPAGLRPTEPEDRTPVTVIIFVAIGLQVVLPGHLEFHPTWLLPSLELVLGLTLVFARVFKVARLKPHIRTVGLTTIALVSLANAWSAGELVVGLIRGTERFNAVHLFMYGGAIYVTNIIVFSLWYWDFDRGGPVGRALAKQPWPDFMFPQMSSPELASPDWRPLILDYLFLSFTNATAFSPTDVMPMSRWAKVLMMVQSAVSLATVSLVIARAINILS